MSGSVRRTGFLFWALSVSAWGADPPLRILFLGNSYTYYNNMAGMVESMARAAGGRPVETRAVTLGGATLEGLYTRTAALDVLRAESWDVVVLQEHSALGFSQFNGDLVVNQPLAFHTWARIWNAEIRSRGARTVFLNTWSRKAFPERQPQLDWAYSSIARELNAGLIPAGAAFAVVQGVDLFAPDGAHPSAAGSYLTACVAVEVLTGAGCSTAPPEIPGVPMDNATARLNPAAPGPIVRLAPADAAELRRAALAAVARLREAGGYWSLERPAFAGENQPVANQAAPLTTSRWTGAVWLYGRQATVTLDLAVTNGNCSGTWNVRASDPPTQTAIPLTSCSLDGGALRFTVQPLFLQSENHQARAVGDRLQGSVEFRSFSPYQRQAGTWTLERAAP